MCSSGNARSTVSNASRRQEGAGAAAVRAGPPRHVPARQRGLPVPQGRRTLQGERKARYRYRPRQYCAALAAYPTERWRPGPPGVPPPSTELPLPAGAEKGPPRCAHAPAGWRASLPTARPSLPPSVTAPPSLRPPARGRRKWLRPSVPWELEFSSPLQYPGGSETETYTRARTRARTYSTSPGVPRGAARKGPSAVGGGGCCGSRRAAMSGHMAVLGECGVGPGARPAPHAAEGMVPGAERRWGRRSGREPLPCQWQPLPGRAQGRLVTLPQAAGADWHWLVLLELLQSFFRR